LLNGFALCTLLMLCLCALLGCSCVVTTYGFYSEQGNWQFFSALPQKEWLCDTSKLLLNGYW